MKKIFILLFFLACFAQVDLLAQRQYVVEYDKKADAFFYFEESRKNGTITRKSLRIIEPEMGDEVKVVVKNVNEFVYKTSVEFRAGEVVSQEENPGNMLISAITSLAPGASMISALASGVSGRGAEIASAADKRMLEQLKALSETVSEFSDRNQKYQGLVDLLMDEDIPIDSLRITAGAVIEELVQNPNDAKGQQAILNSLENGLSTAEVSTDIKREISSALSEMQAMSNANHGNLSGYSIEQLIAIKKLIAETDFQFTAYNTIGFDDMSSSASPEYESAIDERVSAFDVILKFEKIDALAPIIKSAETSKNKNNQSDFIQYLSTSKWRLPSGEVISEDCPGCVPMVLAEGYFNSNRGNNELPLKFKELFENGAQGAYGLWKFYDEETGALKSSFQYTPTVSYEDSYSNNNDQNQAKTIETHYRRARLNIKKAKGPQFSACLLMNRMVEARSQFDIIGFPGDSLQIRSSAVDEFVPSLGVLVDFILLKERAIIPSLNLGATLNVLSELDNEKFNVHLGLGLAHRNLNNLSFIGGISLCRTQVVRDKYTADNWYFPTDFEFEDVSFNQDELFKDVFKTGYYFGIALKF